MSGFFYYQEFSQKFGAGKGTVMKKSYLVIMTLLAVVLWSAVAQADLISNGGFGSGIDPGSYTTIYAGDTTSITDWTVASGSVDYIGTYWNGPAGYGDRSIDMNGLGTGSISITQSFNTDLGKKYILTFDLAGNFDGDPNPKTIYVSVAGINNQPITLSQPISGWDHAHMGWVQKSLIFDGTGGPTTLTFSGDPTILPDWSNGTPWGPALDNVSVNAIPLPPSILLLGSGLAGLGLLRRKWGVKA
jgi:choice-of-anchor C domain-containing protein